MDTGKNKMVGRENKKGAERHPFCGHIVRFHKFGRLWLP